MSTLYCSTPLIDYDQDVCANEPGRIIAIAAIRTDAYATISADITTASTWQTQIDAGKIKVIKNVRGDKPKSADVPIDGFGRQASKSINRDHTSNITFADIIGNEDFWNILNYDSGHHYFYYTQGQRIWDTGNNVANWDGDSVVEEGLNTIVVGQATMTWSNQDVPVSSDGINLVDIFE